MQTLLLSAPLLPPPMRQRAPCTEQRWGLGARHTKCCCPAAHTNQRAICITGAMLMSCSASPPGARRAQKDPPRAPWLFGKLFVFFSVSPAPIPPQRFPFCVTVLPPLNSKCFYRISLHLELLLSWDAGRHFCAGHRLSFPVPSFEELTQSLFALRIAPARLLSVCIYIYIF